MPSGYVECHTCGKKGAANFGYLPRRKKEATDSESNAWWFYCNVCAREFNVETQVNRWEAKFFCGHCWQDFDGEVYVSHVKACLDQEITQKRKTMATGSANLISRLGLRLALAHVNGPSISTPASTPKSPDSGTPLQPAS